MDEFDKLLDEYVEKFHENFPFFLVRGMEEEKLMQIMRESIRNNKPFHPKFDPNADY